MPTQEQITKAVKEVAGNNFELIYTDYRDQLEPEQVQHVIRGNLDALDEWLDSWLPDAQFEALTEPVNEALKGLGYWREDAPDDLIQHIEDEFYNLDKSDVISDRIRQTPSLFFYYDLGLEATPGWTEPKAIVEKMGVKSNHPKYQECLNAAESLIDNASYGGSLVMLFACRPGELYPLDRLKDKYLQFEPAYVCVMDRSQGSGDHEQWPTPIAVKFDPAIIFVDEAQAGYSYSGKVCGLVRSPFEGVYIKAAPDRDAMIVSASANGDLQQSVDHEAELDRTWNRGRGKCTYGDLNIRRHPDNKTTYINDFPCGNKCLACGTFWID